MILALLISHNPDIHISASSDIRTEQHDYDTTAALLAYEAMFTLSLLMEKCLRNLLGKLQSMMSEKKRTNWLPIFYALSLTFFAAESMQVDIYLQSSRARTQCGSMEMKSIFVLAELFTASTAGFDPLSLDWARVENAGLVDDDIVAVESLRNLQTLSHDYCECGK